MHGNSSTQEEHGYTKCDRAKHKGTQNDKEPLPKTFHLVDLLFTFIIAVPGMNPNLTVEPVDTQHTGNFAIN
jgi:hypothetical protein